MFLSVDKQSRYSRGQRQIEDREEIRQTELREPFLRPGGEEGRVCDVLVQGGRRTQAHDTVVPQQEASRRMLTNLSAFIALMVCSHCPTPRLIKRVIKNGLYRIVWKCSYCIETGVITDLHWVLH